MHLNNLSQITSRRIRQSIPIRHRHNLSHDLHPPHNRRPTNNKLAQRLLITILAVRRVPKLNLHRAERRAEVSARGLVIQHVGLANRAGDLGVRESVNDSRAAVDFQLEQFFRGQFRRRSAGFVVGVDQTRCICQARSFWHSAGLERPCFAPLVESPEKAGRHGPLFVFAEVG